MKPAYRYLVAGQVVCSDLPLPELGRDPAGERPGSAISIRLASRGSAEPASVDWRAPEPAENETAAAQMQVGTFTGGFVVAYPEGGRFIISPAGDTIQCTDDGGLPDFAVRHVVLDRVLPLALSLRGDVVLHAGAVALGNAALALAGASGRGKSTLAAYFGTQNAGVLADDCLVVRRNGPGWHAVPYYTGLRLWPGSLEELRLRMAPDPSGADPAAKRRIGPSRQLRFRKEAVPLRMICLLGQEADGIAGVTLNPLSPREAFFALLAQSFSLETRASGVLRKQLETVGRLAEEIPTYALDFPRRFEALSSVGARILSLMAGSRDAVGAA